MFRHTVWSWVCALIVTLIPGCDKLPTLSEPAGAPLLSLPETPAGAAGPPVQVTLNPASGHGQLSDVNSDPAPGPEEYTAASAIYSRRELLQLRVPRRMTRPPSAAVLLIHRLGIRRKRRGIRGGRKSRRPIRVVTTERPPRNASASAAWRSCVLSCPARLNVAETRAISRPPPPLSTTRDRMLVCHANVRSLSARYEEVTALIDAHKPDLLCLSETWLTDDVLDSYRSPVCGPCV